MHDELLKKINAYKSLTKLGLVVEGINLLQQIDSIVKKLDGDKLKEGNCCTLRELVSDMLFKY